MKPRGGDTFPSFVADDVAAEGFDDELFVALARLEEKNFWFRARNELIVWSVRDSFPHARTFFELGCGTGVVLQALRESVPALELAGADLFVSGLEIARSRLPDVPLYRMDARSIPFREEFDLAGVFDVLEHVEDDAAALRELHACLRPGGGLLVTVPQHPWLWSVPDAVAHHRRRYTRAELVGKLGRAGFSVRRVTSFATAILPPMAAARAWYRLRPGAYSLENELDVPAPLNRLLAAAMSGELRLIRAGISLRVGGSLLVVAEKGSA